MAHLLFVTNCFPYSGYTENAFIQPELDVLNSAFESITIIPDHLDEKHINHLDLSNNRYSIDLDYMLVNRGQKNYYIY